MKMLSRFLIFLVCGLVFFKANAQKKEMPNIIFILADDLGYGDISILNKESKIQTPHLDKLAREGVSFKDAHSNSAVCTPTRYGILTGRYCYRSSLKDGVLFGYSPLLIEPDRLTLAGMLKDKGYLTGVVGKWHLGLDFQKKDPSQPLFIGKENWQIEPHTNCDFTKPVLAGAHTVGFDYSYVLPGSLDMAPYVYVEDGHINGKVTAMLQGTNKERGVFYREGEMAVDFDINETLDHFASKSIQFIKENATSGKPFFLYFPLTAPHTPWLPAKKYLGKSGAGIYGDFVMHVDDVVGQIVETVKQMGIEKNTIIVFTSDNGSDWKKEDIEKWQHKANYIFAGRKSDAWDGGHHIPFIVKWPQNIKAGIQNSNPICTTDWMATCADIIGYKLKDNEAEDSYSFLNTLLRSNAVVKREPIIHHSISGQFAIRAGDWKYIDCRGSGGWTSPGEPKDPPGQLYNMKKDPGERHNLYFQNQSKVKELKELLELYKKKSHKTS